MNEIQEEILNPKVDKTPRKKKENRNRTNRQTLGNMRQPLSMLALPFRSWRDIRPSEQVFHAPSKS